ncbi:MAG: SurA N-terminal domain-containing protein [Gammaproteobacteria bacterium]|nr:SurA N-terminal domain-containing protein [Gammaproteobacteria bacterium]
MVLQSIRDRLTGIIAIFIFAILIIPFAFVGVSSYFTSDAVNAVAVVNDQEITISEFNNSFQNYRRRMQAQLGTAFDAELFDQPIIRRQFLDQMIDEELMAQVSIDAGLAVDDQTLAQRITEMEGFHVDGEFNADVYQARLAAQGLTTRQFENEMRVSMTLNQFPVSIATSAIATNWEVNDYARLADQKREFSALIVPAFPDPEPTAEPAEEAPLADEAAAAVPEAPIEEDAILAWYEEHQDEYMSQEMVTVEYIELDAANMGGAIEPDEELLKARFEEQQVRFITPEARLASHILIEAASGAPAVEIESARQQTEDLAARVAAGEDFAELAREFSQDAGSAEEGGDLGWIEPGFMVQAFEDGLYELSLENPVSDPVQTGFGWHIIYLREIRPSEGMTFTEARDILAAEYQAEADERRFLEAADRMVDIIYEDPTTLDAAADELGLEVKEAGPFGRQGAELGVAANMELVNAAFSELVLAQGSVSDPIDFGENHIAVIRLREHLPEALMPLEEVRDRVVESVRSQRAMDAASTRASELLASLSDGADLAELAETSGLELVQSEAATRNETAFSRRLLEQVFLMQAPGEDGPVSTVFELDEGYAVVQLESVTDGELTEEDALRKQSYSRRIANASANTEALGFVRMLREQSTIEVFEDRL